MGTITPPPPPCPQPNSNFPVTILSQIKKSFLAVFTSQVRQMGNVHRHTVQCVANPQSKANTQRLIITPELNTAVCFTIASLLLVHLLYTLVVAPLVNRLFGGCVTNKSTFISNLYLGIAIGLVLIFYSCGSRAQIGLFNDKFQG